jgi:AcrR family transcriptional regulator
MSQKRLAADVRREQIIKAAVAIAERVGYMAVSRRMIGEKLGVSGALIPKHIGTTEELEKAMIQYALAEESIPVIAQLLAMRHEYVRGGLAPATMAKVMEYMSGD